MGRPRSKPCNPAAAAARARDYDPGPRPRLEEIVRRFAEQRAQMPRSADFCVSAEHYTLHALAQADTLELARWELRISLGGEGTEATRWVVAQEADRGAAARALAWLLRVHAVLMRPVEAVAAGRADPRSAVHGLTLDEAVVRVAGALRDWSAVFSAWPERIAEAVGEFELEATRLQGAAHQIDLFITGRQCTGAPVHQRLNGAWARPRFLYDERLALRPQDL